MAHKHWIYSTRWANNGARLQPNRLQAYNSIIRTGLVRSAIIFFFTPIYHNYEMNINTGTFAGIILILSKICDSLIVYTKRGQPSKCPLTHLLLFNHLNRDFNSDFTTESTKSQMIICNRISIKSNRSVE